MAESLKNETVKGVSWSGIDNVVQTGVTFVVSIVLARLLSPDDYGLIGIQIAPYEYVELSCYFSKYII